jgi:hypothetical protein
MGQQQQRIEMRANAIFEAPNEGLDLFLVSRRDDSRTHSRSHSRPRRDSTNHGVWYTSIDKSGHWNRGVWYTSIDRSVNWNRGVWYTSSCFAADLQPIVIGVVIGVCLRPPVRGVAGGRRGHRLRVAG